MSQMNHLLKINMIYICPRGLLYDVITALTSHFIVVLIDVLQVFEENIRNPFDREIIKILKKKKIL